MDSGRAMSCGEVREELVALLDGELEPGTAEGVQAHLEGCDACSRECAALEATRRKLGQALGKPEGVEPRFEELWAEVGSASSEMARRRTATRTAVRRGGASASGRRLVPLALAAGAALAVLAYRLMPTPDAPPAEPVSVVERDPVPPELLDHPDMFVDFVIVRRLEKLRQLPELIHAASGEEQPAANGELGHT